jgi:hypothetical protein
MINLENLKKMQQNLNKIIEDLAPQEKLAVEMLNDIRQKAESNDEKLMVDNISLKVNQMMEMAKVGNVNEALNIQNELTRNYGSNNK